MRIALLCEEAAGARILETLAKGPHELVTILTSLGSPVWRLAGKLGYQPVPARRVREPGFAAEMAASRPDLLLNVHSLYILPLDLLQVPPLGAYNLHPGPLPHCAGLNAPSWALYHGAERHGVTVHRMDERIDTGAIVYEEHFPIGPKDTALSLALRCAQRGVEMIRALLEVLARDPAALPLKPQDPGARRYYGRGVPQGGRIDWSAPARRIHDFVRACDYHPFQSPWGTPRATIEGEEVEIPKVALTGERCDAAPGTLQHGERLLVATADEWLWIRKLRTAGSESTARSAARISATA